jgi:hypothetical protein
MITKTEVYNYKDEVADLDGIAIILRDQGFYWEANRIETAADTMQSMIERMRQNVANDAG